MTKVEREKLNEFARLATKYMQAYTANIDLLQETNDPNKEHTLYYHLGYRDCYDGILKRLREDNLIS